jgi:hypothetical protein
VGILFVFGHFLVIALTRYIVVSPVIKFLVSLFV